MKKTFVLVLFLMAAALMMAITIYDIQYTENPSGDSPYLEQVVTVEEAVVTAVGFKPNSGHASFFLSDPEGGPWTGIYVYDYDEAYVWSLSVGDLVTITATVDEYYNYTELGYVEDCEVIGSMEEPVPYPVTTADLASSESLESCLVQIDDVTVTAAQNDYGEWFVDDGSGACQIDDGFFYLEDLEPPIVINVDDFWGRIVGVIDYSYDEYALNPRTPDDMYPESDAEPVLIEASSVRLDGNYPNPFNPVTQIAYSLDEAARINLSVYDVQGRLVKTLFSGMQQAGEFQVNWNGVDNSGNSVASGIYFSRLSHSKGVETAKMLMLK